jgi:hypothetical protein
LDQYFAVNSATEFFNTIGGKQPFTALKGAGDAP